MPIPDFQSLMLPILNLVADGQVHSVRALKDAMAVHFHMTDEEREELLPSGTVPRFDNNVSWAASYLSLARLLERPSRGNYRITSRGKEVLAEKPRRIDMQFLARFPEYLERRRAVTTKKPRESTTSAQELSHQTPEELLGTGYQQIREALTGDILDKVKSCSPQFFERLVVQLLTKMGYGGSLPEAGQVIGKTGDGGIDGLIKEDKLGLDVIYVQAKRWESVVGRPVVQAFAGSLEGQRARKGVMITTSQFSPDAKEYVSRIEKKIVLIDGYELARLMIDYDVAVTTLNTYAVKRIDSDYFEEE